jgi:hypothetical protein
MGDVRDHQHKRHEQAGDGIVIRLRIGSVAKALIKVEQVGTAIEEREVDPLIEVVREHRLQQLERDIGALLTGDLSG